MVCRLWGPGSAELLERLPAQLGISMPLVVERIKGLPKPVEIGPGSAFAPNLEGTGPRCRNPHSSYFSSSSPGEKPPNPGEIYLLAYGEPAPGPLKLVLPPTAAKLKSLTW